MGSQTAYGFEMRFLRNICWLGIMFSLSAVFGFSSVDFPQQTSRPLKFYTDVFAWYPDGCIKRISLGDGIYFQPCIHPEGSYVVFYGNSSGIPRIWKASLATDEMVPITDSKTCARHPVFDWKGRRIAFSSDISF
jgi:hypothetical protein